MLVSSFCQIPFIWDYPNPTRGKNFNYIIGGVLSKTQTYLHGLAILPSDLQLFIKYKRDLIGINPFS